MLNIEIISCLNDNYSYLLYDEDTNIVAIIDPSDFNPCDKIINKKYNKLDYILNTHHHFDHVGGNQKLKEKYKSKVLGSKIDKDREWLLKNIDQGKWPQIRNDLAKLERELSKLILRVKDYYSEK